MNSFKTTILRIIVSVMIVLMITTVDSALAERININSSINVKSEYSDNISFDRVNAREDFFGSVSPSFALSYSTDQTTVNTNLMLSILRYASESQEDRENQRYRLGASHKLTERLVFGGNFSYRKDTTLDTELTETGEVTRRQDSHRYDGKGSFTWSLSELSAVSMRYSYLKRDLESSDSDRHSLSMSLRRSFNNGLDSISLSPSYTYRDSDSSELDNYNITIGWSHQFSEIFYFDASFGGRYSEERPDSGGQEENSGVVASINLTRKSQTGGMTFGYTRDLFTNTDGDESEVDRFRYSFNRRLLPRIWIRVLGSLYFRREPDGDSGNDETYYSVSPSLQYKLTERHSLSLGYRYAREKNDSLTENSTVDENSIWLNLVFNHSKVW